MGVGITSAVAALVGALLLREFQSATVRYVTSCPRLTPVFEPDLLPEPVMPPGESTSRK